VGKTAGDSTLTITNGAVVTDRLANNAVTYAKMQDVSAASRLLGRGSAAGSGDVEEITVGGGIEFTSSTGIQTTALTGDVTKTAGGTSTTIANDAVTTAKVANAAITPAKMSSDAQVLNFKNVLINGAMQVSQRSTSETGKTASGYYTADRWHMLVANTAGTWTQSIENDAPSGSEFRRSLKMTCTIANTTLDAGDQLVIQQRIEGQNLQAIRKGTSNAQQVTLSFWVKSGTTGTYIAELQDNDNTRYVSASYTVSAANTWEKKTITFPADTSGVLDNDNEFSLAVNFWLAAGSNFTGGTPLQTSWGTTTNTRATGQLNLSSGAVAGTNYWQVTGVQLERGSTATEFEVLPLNIMLHLCHRHFWQISGSNGALGYANPIGFGGWYNSTIYRCVVQFPAVMRAVPTFSSSDGTGHYQIVGNNANASYNSVGLDFASTTAAILDRSVSGATTGYAGWLTTGSASAWIRFNAEL
jgi:hypothetical protein